MKRLEAQPRITKPFIQLVDKVTGRGDTTSLTRADRRDLRLYGKQLKDESNQRFVEYSEQLDQAFAEERERRAKEPKLPTQVEWQGEMLTPLEYWRKYVALRGRLEQERIARGDKEIDYSQLPWRPQPRKYENLSPDERRYHNLTTVRELHTNMVKEVQDAQFDLIAESIKTDVWNDTRKDHPLISPFSSITPTSQIEIGIQDDGTVINRSRVGVSISYAHKDMAWSDRKDKVVRMPQREELTFGIGYFTDREQIIPAARAALSDDELKKGVKSYFIERSYTVEERGEAVRKTEVMAIPLNDDDSMRTFVKHLYASAKSTSPDQTKQRIKASRRNQRAAA